jgi:hypothetical protein
LGSHAALGTQKYKRYFLQKRSSELYTPNNIKMDGFVADGKSFIVIPYARNDIVIFYDENAVGSLNFWEIVDEFSSYGDGLNQQTDGFPYKLAQIMVPPNMHVRFSSNNDPREGDFVQEILWTPTTADENQPGIFQMFDLSDHNNIRSVLIEREQVDLDEDDDDDDDNKSNPSGCYVAVGIFAGMFLLSVIVIFYLLYKSNRESGKK